MQSKKNTFFKIIVYIAYTFYILFGLVWLMTNFLTSKHLNIWAMLIIVIFSVIAYLRNKLANLIAGVISMFFSFYLLMGVASNFNLMVKGAIYDGMVISMLSICFVSILLSGFLIFSYVKFSDFDK